MATWPSFMTIRSTSRPSRASSWRLVAAAVNSGPLWHWAQRPGPRKISMPSSSCVVSAEVCPVAQRSNRASSETSVDSYIMIDSPQNSEKFSSIWV